MAKKIDYPAVTIAALQRVKAAAEAELASLPDEGGLEPDCVKGARSVLRGSVATIRRDLEELGVVEVVDVPPAPAEDVTGAEV
jgi:hypothetical protein